MQIVGSTGGLLCTTWNAAKSSGWVKRRPVAQKNECRGESVPHTLLFTIAFTTWIDVRVNIDVSSRTENFMSNFCLNNVDTQACRRTCYGKNNETDPTHLQNHVTLRSQLPCLILKTSCNHCRLLTYSWCTSWIFHPSQTRCSSLNFKRCLATRVSIELSSGRIAMID